MKHRNPLGVIGLTIITFGIYGIVWQVKTKNEMNSLGAEIPTAWLIIVPFVSLWWLWKYSQGVEKVTNGETSGVLAFVLLFLLGTIGGAILQSEFNKIAGGQPAFAAPAGPAAPATPAPMVGGDMSQPPLPPQPTVNPEPPVASPQPPTFGAAPDPAAPTPPSDPSQPTPPQNPLV